LECVNPVNNVTASIDANVPTKILRMFMLIIPWLQLKS
jgi:hypothetical protein